MMRTLGFYKRRHKLPADFRLADYESANGRPTQPIPMLSSEDGLVVTAY